MKNASLCIAFAAGLALMSNVSHAVTWSGATADWKTDNWGLADGGYVGDANNINSNATINSGTVTISSAIPNSVGAISVKDATLNIGANISSTTGNALLFQGNTMVNHTAGAFAYTGFQTLTLGYNTQADNVQWDMSGGSFSSSQRGLSFGRDGNYNNAGLIEMSISGDASVSVARDIRFTAENATMSIDASAGAKVEVTGNSYGIRMNSVNTNQQAVNFNARLEVSGYHAATILNGKNMDIFQGAFADGSNEGSGSSVVAFTLSGNPNGVNAWTATTLNLGDGTTNAKGDLEVDVTQLPGANAITLFNYTTLNNGSFGNVSINFGATPLALGSDPSGDANNLALNEYYVDYGSGSNDSITLLYHAIPEPGTLALFGLGVLSLTMGRRFIRARNSA